MRNSDTLYFINIKNFKLQNTEKEGKRKKKKRQYTGRKYLQFISLDKSLHPKCRTHRVH